MLAMWLLTSMAMIQRLCRVWRRYGGAGRVVAGHRALLALTWPWQVLPLTGLGNDALNALHSIGAAIVIGCQPALKDVRHPPSSRGTTSVMKC